jgi:pantothenate synthetase
MVHTGPLNDVLVVQGKRMPTIIAVGSSRNMRQKREEKKIAKSVQVALVTHERRMKKQRTDRQTDRPKERKKEKEMETRRKKTTLITDRRAMFFFLQWKTEHVDVLLSER